MHGERIRAFVAVDLPEGIKAGVLGIDLHGLARVVDPQLLHITLNFLGYLESDMVERAIGIVEKYHHEEFDISIAGAGMFTHRGGGVAFVGVHDGAAELDEIHSHLSRILSDSGIALDDKRFTPHVTFARFRGTDRKGMEELSGLLSGYEGHVFGGFRCTGLDLKKSILTAAGPEYSALAKADFTP
ncbi:2',5' RNA ligase [mine drainage metagenome]|uniref:2',5' RNA ligase n=1 Tax=mine drainage metagenome TaxID=410659 RepID=T1AY69_9ZZZZ